MSKNQSLLNYKQLKTTTMKPNKRSSNLNTRRKSALKRLEEQLKSNKKPLESARLSDKILIDLTESDIKRIEKEILTLKTKIK